METVAMILLMLATIAEFIVLGNDLYDAVIGRQKQDNHKQFDESEGGTAMNESQRELLEEVINLVSKRLHRAIERSEKYPDREAYFNGQADAIGFILGVLKMRAERKDGEQHGSTD